MENTNQNFKLFSFTPEIIQQIMETREIPVHFYNREGQIIIYKKKNVTDQEIDRLFRFTQQGKVYYNIQDSEILGIKDPVKSDIPEGFTDTKLLTQKNAKDLVQESKMIFSTLRKTAITSIHARKTSEKLNQVFKDFESNPDSLSGLVNIIELLSDLRQSYEIELATKRVVISMAMKTRGISSKSYKEEGTFYTKVNHLMMSALFVDISYTKMQIPNTWITDEKQMNYIRSHPLISYFLIAHEPSIDPKIKRNILVHHRPMRYDANTNNYPSRDFLIKKLKELQVKFSEDPKKREIVEDITQQISFLNQDIPYDEDAAILCIASEFASLTSKVPWRDGFPPTRAVQMIINNSYFTYPERIVREFLDYTAISLCDNKKVLREGDFVIMASVTTTGKTFFEAAQITNTNRLQSKPGVDRIATVRPVVKKIPKLQISGIDLNSLEIDRRFTHYELLQDSSRRIIYVVNPDYDEELYSAFYKIMKGRYSKGKVIPLNNIAL
ncbi:MAG: hypothetical protein ACK4UJ_05845 [Leptonema sp. (in: bacteria)]